MGCSNSHDCYQACEPLTHPIIESFSIVKAIKEKINNLCFTSYQIKEVIEAILELCSKLQESENQQEKQLVQQIITETSNISLEELKYYKVLQKFRTKTKRENIKHESLSRIYHLIANAQKNKQVERQYSILPQSQHNKQERKRILVNYIQSNTYNVLTTEQLEEVIKLEAVGQKIQDFGTRFKFKLESIRTQSDDINKLLAESFTRYQSNFKGLRYDLDKKEIMIVAEISRNACNYNDNGVVLLLIYLVNACLKQEKNGKSVEIIQQLLRVSIESISQKYPPGQGLKKQQQSLSEALKRLEFKQEFSHKTYTLSPQKKQNSLEQIILSNATTAKAYQRDFEELLQQTCLELSIKIIVGVKLNPDRPNKKAMIRIKEKMLIGKDQSSQTILNKGTVKETINFEEEEYKRKVDKLISDKKDIGFKISDMLRGKCVFVSIPDIILTIDKIKAFVLKDKQKRFRIIQIESRFTNKVPISDVTLKIAIKEEIVAELQLTIQSNAAAYNFAHKVYQLQRAKMFSKIKIVHNYFEEFQADFKELVIRALNYAEKIDKSKDKSLEEEIKKDTALFNTKDEERQSKEYGELSINLTQSYILIQTHRKAIQSYFSIGPNYKVKDFEDIFGQFLVNCEHKHLPAKLIVCADQQLQGMMLALFNKQMGSWESQLGKRMDSVLHSNCSQLLKATLLSFFFRSFDISKEVRHMLQFHPEYSNIIRQLRYSYNQQVYTTG